MLVVFVCGAEERYLTTTDFLTAPARVQFGFAIVSVNGERLHTTMEIGEISRALMSSESEGMLRARIP